MSGYASFSGWVQALRLDRKDGDIVQLPSFPLTHSYTSNGAFLVSLEVKNILSGSTLTGVCTDLVQVNTFCGNGIVETGEQCDDGANNGIGCSPAYGSTCSYCDVSCQYQTIQGSYCGDGSVDSAHGEVCDTGNSNGVVCDP